MSEGETAGVTVTFAGSGDAFGSGGRLQACIHLSADANTGVLLDCGATSLVAANAGAPNCQPPGVVPSLHTSR
jgi:hypothetical protein